MSTVQQSENGKCLEKSIDEKNIFWRVKVIHSNETMYCTYEPENQYQNNDFVIIPTKYGKDLGKIQGIVKCIHLEDNNEIISIERKAEKVDITKYQENKSNEKQAFNICKEKIEKHKLEMKLVSAHYLLEEPKILFFFTAEDRVDFRKLVKDLVAIFRMRIELRQIGVRDESRVLGGIGICGRHYCCNRITDKLNPVSIKMAKEQNISLNSLKISGPCGRLLCCLGYEYEYYQNEKQKLPQVGTEFNIQEEHFSISEINIVNKKIKLISESGRMLCLNFKDFSFDSEEKKWNINSNALETN